MNLTGGPFKSWVTKQINVRQNSLGKYTDIPSSDLQSYTVKTPFLRLASSVNLTNDGPEVDGKKTTLENSVLKKLANSTGIPESELAGPELAKSFILQSGVVSYKNGEFGGLQKGINDGNSLFNGSYGWGGSEERGYVPMPGITDASVTYYSNGALSKTSVNIKLFNKKQFSMFDVLYLRPGYTLLMEFGHSVYLDNEGKLQSMDEFLSTPLSNLLNATAGGTTQYKMYNLIKKEREKYNGNYEAIYGKISKFGWTFNPDGSYDCNIEITGMGDVVASLKANITDPNSKPLKKEESQVEGENPNPPLIVNANKTIINKELYSIYQLSDSEGFSDYTIEAFKGVDADGNTNPKDLVIKNGKFVIAGITSDYEEGGERQAFIKYGAFLAFLQTKIALYNKKQNGSPLISFDFNFEDLEKDENLILKIPGGFSSNPNCCLIPYYNSIIPDEGLDIPNTEINTGISSTPWPYNEYLGKVSQILINTNFIASALESSPQSEGGEINLLEFLKTINRGIMESLGGINNFEFKIDDEVQSKITFYESIPQRREDAESEEYARLNVYGVKPGVGGSFVRNVNLKAELSNNFAAMISIGSQANSNQVGGNATSFSNYSAGLVDRIIEDKLSSTSAEIEDKKEEENTPLTIKSNFENNINQTENSLFQQVYVEKNWTAENIQSLTSHGNTHAGLIMGELTKQTDEGAQLPGSFFLPFNLSLEMDGLSGMKLYQKFLMTNDILPPSYENDGVDLQISGINHNITSQAWVTSVETLSVPADKLAPIKRPAELKSTVTKQKSSSAPSKNKGSCIEKYSNEQYSVTAGGSYKILATYKFSGDDPRAGLSLQGKPLTSFPKLMKSSDGVPLPKAGYGVARKAFEALPVIGAAATAQGINGLTINSNYRSPVYNCTVGGASNSMHKTGGAIDIGTRSPKKLYNLILKLISENKIPQGGVGLYNSFVHYDIRGTAARWKI